MDRRIPTAWLSAIARRLRPASASDEQRTPGQITREHVVWGYRLFLDRDPENEGVIAEKLNALSTTRDLRTCLMISSEFAQKNLDRVYMNERNVVIKEISDQLRLFVDLSDHIIGLGIIRGEYEQSEIDFVRQTLRPGWNVLDIGANIGLFTITMAELVGPTGRVYAFEPLQRTAELLERSVIENQFEDRVTVERAAVSAQAGSSLLISPRQTLNWGGAYLLAGKAEVPDDHIAQPVRTVRLDSYPLYRPVHFLKIDIEGAEPLAIRGAKEILQEDRPIILSEIHAGQLNAVADCTPAEFIGEMDALGYECRVLGEAGTIQDAVRQIIGGTTPGIRSVAFLPRP